MGATQLLTRAVGPQRAAHMMLTSSTVKGAEAVQTGLCSEVLPADQVMPRALVIARMIAAGSPLAVRDTVRSLRCLRDEVCGYLSLDLVLYIYV